MAIHGTKDLLATSLNEYRQLGESRCMIDIAALDPHFKGTTRAHRVHSAIGHDDLPHESNPDVSALHSDDADRGSTSICRHQNSGKEVDQDSFFGCLTFSCFSH